MENPDIKSPEAAEAAGRPAGPSSKSPPRLTWRGQLALLWENASDLLWGYDYFIAHRSIDGKDYATALYKRLTEKGNELDCFLDSRYYHAGGLLKAMQTRALKSTTRLIVLLTARAHDPDSYVLKEVRQFRELHPSGVIVPIADASFCGQTWTGPDSELLRLLPTYPAAIWLPETSGAFAGDQPSETVVAKLLNDFSEQRRSTFRQRVLKGAVAILLGLLLLAVYLGWQSYQRGNDLAESLKNERAANLERVRQTNIGHSRLLSILATEKRQKRLDTSLLLSAAAYDVSPTLEAVNSLYHSLLVRPALQRFLAVNKAGPVGLAFLADGRTLAVPAGFDLDLYDTTARGQSAKPASVTIGEYVTAAAISPDGRFAAAACMSFGRQLSIGIRLVDLTTRTLRQEAVLRTTGQVIRSLAFSPDSKYLAVVFDGQVLWIDLQNNQSTVLPQIPHGPVSLAFSPSGTTLAVGCVEGVGGSVRLFDLGPDVPAFRTVLEIPEGSAHSLAFNGTGTRLAVGYTGATHGFVCLDAATGARFQGQAVKLKKGMLKAVACRPGGDALAVSYEDSGGGGVQVYDFAEGSVRTLWEVTLAEITVTGIAFDPTGTVLAASSANISSDGVLAMGSVALFDADGRHPLSSRFGPPSAGPCSAVAQSLDGKVLASAVKDGIDFFEAGKLSNPAGSRLDLPGTYISQMMFSPDAKTLAAVCSAGQATKIALYDWQTRKPLGSAPLPESVSTSPRWRFSKDGSMLAVQSRFAHTLSLFRTKDLSAVDLDMPQMRGRQITGLALNPDFTLLAASFEDTPLGADRLVVVSRAGNSVRWRFADPGRILGFSPDGVWLAAMFKIGFGEEMRLLKLDSGEWHSLDPGEAGSWNVSEALFSPDSRLVAALAPRAGLLLLHDIRANTTRRLSLPFLPSDGVEDFAFSPDGKVLALASRGTFILYDLPSGDLYLTSKMTDSSSDVSIQQLQFTSDNRSLIVTDYGSADRATLWNIDPASWAALAREKAGRFLTPQEIQDLQLEPRQ